MPTRARIGVMTETGSVHSIICEYDGYLEHTGLILLNCYSDMTKLDELILLGNIDHLTESITKIKSIGASFVMDHSEKYYIKECLLEGMDYFYLYKDHRWYVGSKHVTTETIGLNLLENALQTIAVGEESY
jgi:hypothetical protein